MNEKMYRARSPRQEGRHLQSFKGYGVTAKWTPVYIDHRIRGKKLEKLKLKLKLKFF